MKNAIIVILLLCIAAGIVFYLCKAKKRGDTCIGCPYAKQCNGKCDDNCSTKVNSKEKPN